MKALGMYIFGGSQTIGHMQTGWQVDKILEMTEDMDQINAYHFTKNYPDIKIVKPSEWNNNEYIESLKNENYDFIFGNPPCSGLSSLNRHASADSDTNNHIYEVINMVKALEPKCFLIENAPTLTTLGLPILKNIVEILDKYKFTIINDIAGNHNVSMYRKRTFVVGWNKEYFNNQIPLVNEGKQPMLTLRECLKGLNDSSLNMELDNEVLHPQFFKFYNLVNTNESIDLALVRNLDLIKDQLEPKDLEYVLRLRDRINTKSSIWDKSSVRPSLDERAPSMASLTQLMHPTENRDFYIREYARVMGYPDEFKFYPNECKCKTVQCLAQGVPVNFIKYISNEIKMCYNRINNNTIDNVDVQYINQVGNARKIVNYTKEQFFDTKKIYNNINENKQVNLW